jgi:hypothetical protein
LQTIESIELHRVNAHAHTTLSVREFSAKKCIPVLPQAPYYQDSSPRKFYLFPKLKSRLKGYNFQTVDSVQKAVTDVIKTPSEADIKSYEGWKIRVVSEDVIMKGTMLIQTSN